MRVLHTIRECRGRHDSLNAAIDRCIQVMAAILVGSPGVRDKIDLGIAMGRLSATASRLLVRKDELLDAHRACHSAPRPDHECALGDLIEGLLEQVAGYPVDGVSAILDAPSLQILEQLKQELALWSTHRIAGLRFDPQYAWEPNELPKRPESWIFSPRKIVNIRANQDLIEQPEQWKRFLHYVMVDVEVSAMEVCSIMILQNPAMPRAFRYDLSRQIWDEARHAMIVGALLDAEHGRAGEYPYSAIVVRRFDACSGLAEQLAAQQVIQEGNALEVNEHLIATLRAGGKTDAAEAFEFINADECEHVRIGNRWLKYLVGEEEGYLSLLQAAARKIDIPAEGKGAWNPGLRARSGAPRRFLEWVNAVTRPELVMSCEPAVGLRKS